MQELDLLKTMISIPTREDREEFLERECGDQPELRNRLAEMTEVFVQSKPALDLTLESSNPFASDNNITDENAGCVIAGKYILKYTIGEGGMGSVWYAEQTEPVKRSVAVKLIKPGMCSKQSLARFDAERQALALMDHPNIAKVLDGGLDHGRPFFVMELVNGEPITQYCDRFRLSPRQRIEIFIDVCQAIQHAHQKGIIHRDIKPSNVLVTQYDDRPVVKVIDFGVAKATGAALTEATLDTGLGALVGTPQYMSPEQATLDNVDIDTRSDIYSLGVLLYEILTGCPPFIFKELLRAGLMEVLRVVREEDPPRPSSKLSTADTLSTLSANRGTEPKKLTGMLRDELDWVVMKAIEKDRARRYDTAAGLAADLQRYLMGDPVSAHPPSVYYRLSKAALRHQGKVIAATAIFLVLCVGIFATGWQALRAEQARAEEALHRKRAEIKESEANEAKADALASAEQERQAKLRESQRAEAELKAKEEAEKNLAFAVKGNEILASIFKTLDPTSNYANAGELIEALREKLGNASRELEESAVGDPLTVARMQETLGLSFLNLGDEEQAIRLFEKVVATRTLQLGGDHPETILGKGNLAISYSKAHKPDMALPLLIEAMKVNEDRFGENHASTINSINSLAAHYFDDKQFDSAILYLERSLALSKANLGEDHESTLLVTNNLALAYGNVGQLNRAISLAEECLARRATVSGVDHPSTLSVVSNLAALLVRRKDFETAIPFLERALKGRKAKLGENHPDTLTSLNNLAYAFEELGKRDEALVLYLEALNRMEKLIGPDHPSTLLCRGNLAELYREMGKSEQSLSLSLKILEYRQAKLGADNPDTLLTLNNVGLTYADLGDWNRALEMLNVALETSFAKLGAAHPLTRAIRTSLANTYRRSARYAEAIPLFKENLGDLEATFGRGDPQSQVAVASLGRAYKYAGFFDESLPLLEEAYDSSKQQTSLRWVGDELLSVYFKTGRNEQGKELADKLLKGARSGLRPGSIELAGKLASLGSALLEGKLYSDAEPLLRECLAIRQKEEPNAWTTYNTMSMLGEALATQQNIAEAESLLLSGYEGLKAKEATMSNETKFRLPQAVDRLIEFYKEAGREEEFERYKKLREELSQPSRS